MEKLELSLPTFVKALDACEPVWIDDRGNWSSTVSLFDHMNNPKILLQHHIEMGEAFLRWFDGLERVPVVFGAEQTFMFSEAVKAAVAVERYLCRFAKTLALVGRLRRRYLGLLYRLEAGNGGYGKSVVDAEVLRRLMRLARNWKHNQGSFWDKELLPGEKCKLLIVSCYVDFTKLLMRDQELLGCFLDWIIREDLPVAPFVQFPALQEKLVSSRLGSRIGRIGGGLLKVQKRNRGDGVYEKVLTLPIEEKEESLLDPGHSVVLKGNTMYSIGEIFEEFSRKPYQVGHLEFFSQGVTNWNAHRLGWWNTEDQNYHVIALDTQDWWTQLPTMTSMSVEQAVRRYQQPLDGVKWCIVAKASREHSTLTYERTHAYLEMVIPDQKGFYQIYDFGKMATRYPRTTLESWFIASASIIATIAYPDDDVFSTERQHVGYAFIVEPEKGRRIMETIKEDIERSRKGDIVFQIEAESCGKWIQQLLEEHLGAGNVPNLFRCQMIDTEPSGFVGFVFDLVRKLPRSWQGEMLKLLQWPFGPWRGKYVVEKDGQKVWKSLTASHYWQDTVVYLPALLHKRHESIIQGKEVIELNPFLQEKRVSEQATIADLHNPLLSSWDILLEESS